MGTGAQNEFSSLASPSARCATRYPALTSYLVESTDPTFAPHTNFNLRKLGTLGREVVEIPSRHTSIVNRVPSYERQASTRSGLVAHVRRSRTKLVSPPFSERTERRGWIWLANQTLIRLEVGCCCERTGCLRQGRHCETLINQSRTSTRFFCGFVSSPTKDIKLWFLIAK
jgi:hypothetical protein